MCSNPAASKGHVRHFFGVRFAWHVLESCCCSSVSQLRTKDWFFMDSKGLLRHFFGVLWFLEPPLDIPPRGWARFAIWGFVLALDLAPGTCRLNLCSTLWARVCVCTDYNAIFDAKLFATMPCGMYASISNGAIGASFAIGALVFYPSRCLRYV